MYFFLNVKDSDIWGFYSLPLGKKIIMLFVMCGSRGGSPPPLKIHKSIGFLSNSGPDPMKKLRSYRASIQCWAIISTPAKRFACGPMMARLKCSPLIKNKNTLSKLDPICQNFLDARRLLIFFKINFFQEYHLCVKKIGSRSCPTFCRA